MSIARVGFAIPVLIRRSFIAADALDGRYLGTTSATKWHMQGCLANYLGLPEIPLRWHDDFSDELERIYPLDADMLSLGAQKGNTARMARIVKKLSRGETVYVMVIGGSFTMGKACVDDRGRDWKECSWVARVHRWFQAAFPRSKIVVFDESRLATPITSFLSGMGATLESLPQSPDLVLIDTLDNDAYDPTSGVHQINRSELNALDFTSVAFEATVRFFREVLPKAQLIVVVDGCPKCLKVAPMQTKVATHYRLPIANYAHLVSKFNSASNGMERLWPKETWGEATMEVIRAKAKNLSSKVNTTWPHFFPSIFVNQYVFPAPRACVQHPPWVVHQYLADLVTYTIVDSLESACRTRSSSDKHDPFPEPTKTLWPTKNLNSFAACKQPLSYYSSARVAAADPARPSEKPIIVSGDWRLFEDRAGKPGWIATQVGSCIQFPIRLSGQGLGAITISWLTSYEGVGDAWARTYPSHNAADVSDWVRLDGRAEKFSQVKTKYFVGTALHRTLIKRDWIKSQVKNLQYVVQMTVGDKMDCESKTIKSRPSTSSLKVKIVEVSSC